MVRTYSVKYKSKSKILPDEETKSRIMQDERVTDCEVRENSTVITITADDEVFSDVMNKVVNVFRKIDDKSEVSYKFGLNNN